MSEHGQSLETQAPTTLPPKVATVLIVHGVPLMMLIKYLWSCDYPMAEYFVTSQYPAGKATLFAVAQWISRHTYLAFTCAGLVLLGDAVLYERVRRSMDVRRANAWFWSVLVVLVVAALMAALIMYDPVSPLIYCQQ